MVNLLSPARMTISAPTPNVISPEAHYVSIINAYIPASSVTPGTQFQLVINVVYASTTSSVGGSRWINAYQWGTLSVSSSTTLYNGSLGYKLTYYSNGSTWIYTGSWSFV